MVRVISKMCFFISFFIGSVGAASLDKVITFNGGIVEDTCELTQSEDKLVGSCRGPEYSENVINYNNIYNTSSESPYSLPGNKGDIYIGVIDKESKVSYLNVIYK